MLNDTNISTFHYHILLVTISFKYPEVYGRADYSRLRDAFEIVLHGETPQDEILFDYILDAHKLLIERTQIERQKRWAATTAGSGLFPFDPVSHS
jgi:hypothetical protein